jgi:protein-arginine kinase activator protein McsA
MVPSQFLASFAQYLENSLMCLDCYETTSSKSQPPQFGCGAEYRASHRQQKHLLLVYVQVSTADHACKSPRVDPRNHLDRAIDLPNETSKPAP